MIKSPDEALTKFSENWNKEWSKLTEADTRSKIIDPLPRVDEIDPLVDTNPRAVYFRQAENGLYIRMALIDMIMKAEL